MAVQFVGGLLQMALCARILGPEYFGILSIFIAITLFLGGFVSMGGPEAVTAYVTRSMAEGRTEEAAQTLRFVLGAALGLGVVAYGLLALTALAFSEVIGVPPQHREAMLVFGVSGVFLATHLECLAALRMADRLSLALAATAAGALTRLAVLAVLWITGSQQLLLVTLAFVAGALVTGGGMFLAVAASSGRSGLPRFLNSFSVRVPADVVRFQLISSLQTKLGAVGWRGDVILMGALADATQTGLYRAASQIVEATRMPVTSVGWSVQTEYSRRWYANDGAGLRRVSRRATLFLFGLATVLYGLLALFHESVIRIVLGAEFADAATPLLLLLPGGFAFMCAGALSVLPAATGRALPALVWSLAALVAMVTAMLLLVPEHGAKGVAWARSIYFVVLAVVAALFAVQVLRESRRRGA